MKLILFLIECVFVLLTSICAWLFVFIFSIGLWLMIGFCWLIGIPITITVNGCEKRYRWFTRIS